MKMVQEAEKNDRQKHYRSNEIRVILGLRGNDRRHDQAFQERTWRKSDSYSDRRPLAIDRKRHKDDRIIITF